MWLWIQITVLLVQVFRLPWQLLFKWWSYFGFAYCAVKVCFEFQSNILPPSSGWLHPAQGDAEVIGRKECVSYIGRFWGVLIAQFWKGWEGTVLVPSQQDFGVPRTAFFRVNKRICVVGKMKVINFICMGVVIQAGDVASGGLSFLNNPCCILSFTEWMGHFLVTLSLSYHGNWQSILWTCWHNLEDHHQKKQHIITL